MRISAGPNAIWSVASGASAMRKDAQYEGVRMERLAIGHGHSYSAVEASIHVGRYALALPFAVGRRVLDIACGEGYGAWLMSEAGAISVDGVDVAEEAISRAASTFQRPGVRFTCAGGEGIPGLFPKASFDLIVSIETIEHVSDPVDFLRALKSVAAPGAVIIISCPNDHWYFAPHESNPYHLRKYTFAEFCEITTSVLGDQVQWLIGSASLGFSAAPIDLQVRVEDAELPMIVRVAAQKEHLRVPSSLQPDVSDCSYFVGIWNAGHRVEGAGASHMLSMDLYARMMTMYEDSREGLSRQVAKTELLTTTLRRENEVLSDQLAKCLSRLEELSLENGAIHASGEALRVERDASLKELAGLRREHDTLAAERDALLPAAARWRALSSRVHQASPLAAKLLQRGLRLWLDRGGRRA